MFVFKASTLINKLHKHAPEIINTVKQSVDNATTDFDFICLEQTSFASAPNISIDYALMEKSQQVVVVPLEAQWSDMGSFAILDTLGTKDDNGNVIEGCALTQQTTNTYIRTKQHLVATIGIKDLIIVHTPNATLVAHKDNAKDIQKIAADLPRHATQIQHQTYRPWGWYEIIETGKHFQVKKLHINANARISLQTHQYRAEYWVVVTGTAIVTNDKQILTLNQGDSTYIPPNIKHAIHNQTNKPLEIIEVQSGAYLGEDDIVRFENIY